MGDHIVHSHDIFDLFSIDPTLLNVTYYIKLYWNSLRGRERTFLGMNVY